MSVDPIPESPCARQPVDESTTATGGLGGGERLVDGSATVLEVTVKNTGSLGVEARAADGTSTFGVEGPSVAAEQTALPEALGSMVGHAI